METRLVLVSRGLLHPTLVARHRVAVVLASLDSVAVRKIRSIERLKKIDSEGVSAVILHGVDAGPPSALDEWVDRFLLDGGGVLVLGSRSLDAPGAAPEARRTAGAGRVVRRTNEYSRIFDEVPDFSLGESVDAMPLDDAWDVHFSVVADGEEDLPVVVTRYRGKGRLCRISVGKRAQTVREPAFESLVRQAVHWVVMH